MRYLAIRNFADWKNFVITRHFRIELNVGVNDKRRLDNIDEVAK